MSVVIRLRRMGAKKDPKFRIVVAESKSPRDGRFVDELGSYNPQPKEAELRVDAERAKYWLSVGASPSDQVKSLFKKAGIPLPLRATKPKKKAEAKKAEAKKAKQAKGPTKRVQAKKARVAAKATAPTKKPAKKAVKKATAK